MSSNNVTGFLYNAFDEQRESTRYGVDLGAPSGGQGSACGRPHSSTVSWPTIRLARRITTEYDNVGRISQVTQPTVTSYYLTGGALQPPSSVTPVSGAATVKYEYSAFGEIFHEARKVDDIGTDGVGRPGHWRDTWHYFDNMGRESRTVDA